MIGSRTAPLAGIQVLDLTRVLPGPFASMMLADLGAEVIKVEHPKGGDLERQGAPKGPDGESYRFGMLNRNKRSIAVDLKSPDGKALGQDLAEARRCRDGGFSPRCGRRPRD